MEAEGRGLNCPPPGGQGRGESGGDRQVQQRTGTIASDR